MSDPIPFRPVRRTAGSPVLPLHRRPPRPRTRPPEWTNPRSIDPDACVQRAYYLEARRGFPTDSALAEAMGVNRSQVSRWAQGRAAHAGNAWLLRDLAATVSRLADCYNAATIHRWLFAPNAALAGGVPMSLLRQRRLPEVLAAVATQTRDPVG